MRGLAAGLPSGPMEATATRRGREIDPARRRQLQADARRSLSENLAQGIALSHKLHRFAGVAARR
jgi:hypothetical protein